MKYHVYNKLYHKGRSTGRAYLSGKVEASSPQAAAQQVERRNKAWNRNNKGWEAKVVEVKLMRTKPKNRRSSAGFGLPRINLGF